MNYGNANQPSERDQDHHEGQALPAHGRTARAVLDHRDDVSLDGQRHRHKNSFTDSEPTGLPKVLFEAPEPEAEPLTDSGEACHKCAAEEPEFCLCEDFQRYLKTGEA